MSVLNNGNPAELPVHQRIRYARLTAGLSAVQLCEKLNIDASTMSRYETGQITLQGMDVELLKNIAVGCGKEL